MTLEQLIELEALAEDLELTFIEAEYIGNE